MPALQTAAVADEPLQKAVKSKTAGKLLFLLVMLVPSLSIVCYLGMLRGDSGYCAGVAKAKAKAKAIPPPASKARPAIKDKAQRAKTAYNFFCEDKRGASRLAG